MEPIEPRPPDPIPVKGWQEILKEVQLREGPDLDDLSPEEESIIEDIIASDAIQVRTKNWLTFIVISALEASPLRFLPFKKRVIAFVYDLLLVKVDDLVDRAKKKLR